MNKLFERLLKLGIIATFIYCLFTEQHYYSVFLRWTVFISSIYFVYNESKHKIRNFGIIFNIIFFGALTIFFNPFIALDFPETTWRIIDLVVCLFLAITLDWKEYIEPLYPKDKLRFILVKDCFWGIVIVIGAFWFVSYIIQVNPFDEYLLITNSKISNGFITKAAEHESEVNIPDFQGGGSESITEVIYDYYFITQNGEIINNKSSDVYLQEFKNKPLPIQVEYIPDHPTINRIKGFNNQCKTMGEFIWRRVGLGMLILILFSSIGYHLIRKAVKNYLTANKKLPVNIQ